MAGGKQIALGKAIAAIAGKNKKFGKQIDKLDHNSPSRLRMAKARARKK